MLAFSMYGPFRPTEQSLNKAMGARLMLGFRACVVEACSLVFFDISGWICGLAQRSQAGSIEHL